MRVPIVAMQLALFLNFMAILPASDDDSMPRVVKFELGCEALMSNEVDEAQLLFESCLLEQPSNPKYAFYLACCYAQRGQIPLAVEWLTQAVEWGYDDAELVLLDPDLVPLHKDAAFLELVGHMRLALEHRLSTRTWGHDAQIEWKWNTLHPPAVSPFGDLLATARVRDAHLWDAYSGEMIAFLRGDTTQLVEVQFDPSGAFVVTLGCTGRIRIWDAGGGTFLRELESGGNSGSRLSFSSDASVLACAADDHWTVWEFPSGHELLSISTPTDGFLKLSPDGLYALTGSQMRRGSEVSLWEVVTGHRISQMYVPGNSRFQGAFSRDGELAIIGVAGRWYILAVPAGSLRLTLGSEEANLACASFVPGGPNVVTTDWEGRLQWWSLENGESIRTLLAGRRMGSLLFHPIVDPEGHYIVLQDTTEEKNRGQLVVHDADSGRELWRRRAESGAGSTIHARFTADGKELVIASRGGSWEFHDSKTGQLLRRGGDQVLHPGVADCHPARPWAAVPLRDGRVSVFDIRTGATIASWQASEGSFYGLLFSPDGRSIVTMHRGGAVRVWESATGKRVAELIASSSSTHKRPQVDINPNGSSLMIWREDGGLTIWSTEDWRPIAGLELQEEGLCAAAWSPAGERVATSSRDGTIRIWSATTGEVLSEDLRHDRKVESIAFQPKGSLLAVGCRDGLLRIWDLDTWEIVRDIIQEDIFGFGSDTECVSFSPDGERFITTSSSGYVQCWTAEDTEQVWLIDLGGGGHPISAEFVRGGAQILVSGGSLADRLVSSAEGATILDLGALRLENAALSADSRSFIATRAGAIHVVDTATGQDLLSRIELAGGNLLIVTSTLYYWGLGEGGHHRRIFLGGRTYPLESFASVLFDPKRARAAAVGIKVAPPDLRPPPEVVITSPKDRVFVTGDDEVILEAKASDPAGLLRFEVERGGRPLRRNEVTLNTELSPDCCSGKLTLRIKRPRQDGDVKIGVRVVSKLGFISRPSWLTIRYE